MLAVLVQVCKSSTFKSSRIPDAFRASIIKPNLKSNLNMVSPGVLNSVAMINHPLKVAYQGEPGAYSEKAARELLGSRIVTVPYQSFEDAFKAVANNEVNYAVVPIENSLGGSIHTNFDLLLRYDLHIIAEHEFKVEHALLVLPGVKREMVKKVMSHPQALAQCDNYIRAWGVTAEAAYDTAGSAKMIRDKNLTDCAAIASDLAGDTYGLEVLDRNIEDYDENFTRFLLLSKQSVSALLTPTLPAKTSIVFVVQSSPGALYKALACFTLRDIDFSKIESRPTSVDLLNYLKFQSATLAKSPLKGSTVEKSKTDRTRFRYCIYLDFLGAELDDRSQNALLQLREQSEFVRVLGSYPRGSELIGPIKNTLATLSNIPVTTEYPSITITNKKDTRAPLKIGIIGFGNFGQFLAKTFIKNHEVYCVDRNDRSSSAKEIGCEFFPLFDLGAFAKIDCDVILLSVSIISFEEVLRSLPKDILKGKLIVDVLSVKGHAKSTMLSALPENCDILCTHPMFGPESGKNGWQGLPFLYEKVRIKNAE
eukprot:gene7668-10432_t